MKARGGPQKLRFAIASCTGEDSDYPVRELLYHSPQTRGWQAPRFCKYPLEILIKLEFPSKIQQIQILSHEYKIATKVEVYISHPELNEEVHGAPFKRLGYLSFDSNERSNYQARELKSVHVNVPATLMRLIIHRCHVNKLNIYNQVGLVALNLIGEPIRGPMEAPPGGYLQLHANPTHEIPYYNAAGADVADLNLDIHVDTVTAAKIRELARMKEAAVGREDYDEAKMIKASIDRLKVMGQKIAQLEMRKKAAVEKEDYDTAKVIKADIDKLRAAGEAAAGSDVVHSRNKNPEEIFERVLRSSQNGPPGSAGPSSNMQKQASLQQQASMQQQSFDEMPAMSSSRADEGYESMNQAVPSGSIGLQRAGSNASKFGQYDERPAQAKGRYGTPPIDEMGAGPNSGAAPVNTKCDIPAPSGWPGNLPGPEPLTGNDRNDATGLEELAGEYVARAMYSKNWQLRDAALSYLGGQVQSGGLGDKRDVFRTLSRVVQKSMKDKVANVFLSSLGLFQILIESLGAAAGPSAVQSMCQGCLPLLIDKLGDNTPKIRDAAKDSIMYLAGIPDAQLRQNTSSLLKPVKNQSAWRPVLGVLTILQELIPIIGISKNGDGFDLEELMGWVGKAYNSPNADVRSAAVQVTKVIHDMVGPAVRKHMPKDINPKIKEQLEEVLGADTGPVPAAAPAPAAKKAASKGAAAPAAGGGGGAAARGRQPSNTNQARKGGATAAAAASAPPVVADEPGPYLEEMAQREAQHGPDHPRVAETCSNLAILYNQRGDMNSALPLYERALAIYEKAYGGEHPDVAHTLTDLAVLHLEQGNDEIGRPLLERALGIQERALGPDHPDVQAIKDVLNS